MTHTSSFRYGPAHHDAHSDAKSGEVRVSYFDPATGERRKPEPRTGERRRAVLVDGVRFESVVAAAEEVGVSPQALGAALRRGRETCRRRRIEFARE